MRKIIATFAAALFEMPLARLTVRNRQRLLCVGLVMLAAFTGLSGMEQSARASSANWTGSTDALWTTTTNWSGAPAIVPGTGDTATFNAPAGVGGTTINFGASNAVTLNNLVFDGATASYLISTGSTQTLTLNNGGSITMNSGVAASPNVRAKIVLGTDGTAQNFTFTNNGGGTLTFNTPTTLTGSTGPGLKTLTLDGTGPISFVMSVGDGLGGGAVRLVKSGNGATQLGSSGTSQTYTGGTYLNQGTLNIVGSNLPANTSLFIAGGTTLGGINQVGTYTNITQQWNGDFTDTMSQPMTFNGGTVDLGALNVGGTSANSVRLLTASAGNFTINSVVSNGTNGLTTGLTKAGAGTLTLGGLSTYTGPTTVTAGTIQVRILKNVGVDSSLGQPITVADGTISLGSGATAASFAYIGGGDSTDRVINLAGTIGGLTLDLPLTGTITNSGGVKFTSDFTATGAGSKTLTLQGASTVSFTGNTLPAGIGEIAGAIVDNSGANKTSVTKTGAGIWKLSGTNTYTGATTLSQGTLSVAADANLGNANSLIFAGGTLRITGTALTSYASGLIGTHAVTLNSGATVGLDIFDPAHTFTVSQALTQGGGGLTKVGLGTLVLNNATNTYTGATTLNAGTLVLRDTAAGHTQTAGTLNLAGPDVTLRSDRAGSGTLSTTFGALTARVAGNTANIVSTGGTNGVDNIINTTGAAGFVDKGIFFNGADFAARNATNTYLRPLAYGSDPNAAAVNTITAGNHVKLTGTPAPRVGDTLLSLNLAGGGVDYTMTSGALTAPGIIKSGGGAASTISGGSVALGTETVIRTDLASDILDINTAISGTALTKSGAGTLRLSGNTSNAISGMTTVNGGTLEINKSGAANALNNGGLTINSGGLVKYTGTSTDMIAAIGPGAGGQVNINGSGQFDFNGKTDAIFNVLIIASGVADTTPILNTAGGGSLSVRNLNINPANGFTSWINSGTGTLSTTASITSNSSSFGRVRISGNLAPAGTFVTSSSGATDYDMLIDAVISGGATMNKSGIGTLRLTGANTFTGITSVAAGTITINTIQNAGSATANSLGVPTVGNSTIGISDTGTLQYIGSTTGSSNRVINLATSTGGIFTLDASGSATFALSGNVTTSGTSGTSVLTLIGTGAGSESGTIVNGTSTNVTALAKSGTGTWTLSGANTYSGKTRIHNGTLSVATLNNIAGPSANSHLGRPTTVANGAIDFGLGTTTGQLTYTGTGETTDRVVSLAGATGGATIDQSGTGLLKFTSGLSAPGISWEDNRKTLTLQGSTAGTGEIAGAIVDSTLGIAGQLATAVSKTGSGTWTLSGNSTYTGATNITAGELRVTGNIASSALTTLSGGTLSGTGTVGALTVTGGTLAPGNTPGTMNSAGNVIWGNHNFEFEIDDANGLVGVDWDLLNITSDGDLDLSGLTAGGLVIELVSQDTTMTDTLAPLQNWNDASNYAWTFARVDFDDNGNDDAITGFDAGDFSFDLTNFNNNNPVTGAFSVQLNGEELQIVYTSAVVAAVPEPATFALAALGLAGLGCIAWRRRRTV